MRLTARRTGRWGGLILLALALLCLVPEAQGAVPAPHLLALTLSAPPQPGDSTIRARLKACVLLGDMECVVAQYLALKNLGRMPDWLVMFRNAFAVGNRRAGECEKVARTVYNGLRQFGEKPEFIKFTVKGEVKLMGFDEMVNGVVVRTHQVATTGYHVAVKLGDKVIDAYTGFLGLPLRDYMARLQTDSSSRIVHEIVEAI